MGERMCGACRVKLEERFISIESGALLYIRCPKSKKTWILEFDKTGELIDTKGCKGVCSYAC